MTHESTATKAAPAPQTARAAKPLRKPKGPHGLRGGTPEANRLAVAILEVLAGIRTPTEAAKNVGYSLVRYFQLETRALQGLVQALEPRPKGKQPSLEGQLGEEKVSGTYIDECRGIWVGCSSWDGHIERRRAASPTMS